MSRLTRNTRGSVKVQGARCVALCVGEIPTQGDVALVGFNLGSRRVKGDATKSVCAVKAAERITINTNSTCTRRGDRAAVDAHTIVVCGCVSAIDIDIAARCINGVCGHQHARCIGCG